MNLKEGSNEMDDRRQQGTQYQEPSVAPLTLVVWAIESLRAFGGVDVDEGTARRLATSWVGRHQLTAAEWADVWAYMYPRDSPK